jgi:hypothetical protein
VITPRALRLEVGAWLSLLLTFVPASAIYMPRRHIPREQKLDLVRLRANNPAVRVAHNLGCTDRTVRRVNHLTRMIGDVVRQPEQCGRPRKLNGVHVAVCDVAWSPYHI